MLVHNTIEVEARNPISIPKISSSKLSTSAGLVFAAFVE